MTHITDEEWRPVAGFENEYEVSSLGRVRSVTRVMVYSRIDQYSGRTITVNRTRKGQELRPGRTSSGHMTVALGRGNSRYVHTLVLEAFRGACPAGMEGLHGDDVPSNNHLDNLRWGTRSENLHDAVANGKKAIGSMAYQAKLTEADVISIKRYYGHMTAEEVGKQFGVSGGAIRQIRRGEAWKHVDC